MPSLNIAMLRFVTASIVFGLLCGCSGEVAPENALAKANETNLQRLANLYVAFQSENNWVGPSDEAQFKEYLKTYSAKKLTRIGIDPAATDQLFVSERDNQPFKIRYSVPGSMMGSQEPVIFESEGIDGQRQVGFTNMSQREVGSEEYDLLWAGKAPIEKTPARDSK